MQVADILQAKGFTVISIKPTDTIAALSQLLRARRVGAAVVSSDGKRLEGVITERDICYAVAVHGAALHTVPVATLMTSNVITCTPKDSVAHVASTMLSRKFRHIPVVDHGKVVGMVSIRDVLNLRVDELQQQTAHLRSFAQSESVLDDR